MKYWDFARLVWIQTFKRNPFNLRRLFLVPKEYNAKGIALFLTGYCNIYNEQKKSGNFIMGSAKVLMEKIIFLANLLISMQTKGYSGACWGYNFDWQARRLFLFPKNTPTVVATSFAATGLFQAFEITGNQEYKEAVLSAGEFILKDLGRTPKSRGFLFSYSPLEGNNTVYNASLLGSKTLSLCYYFTKDKKFKDAAKNSVMACVDAQQKNGSWLYGELPVQNWIDSFHTGYNLEALAYYQRYTGDSTFSESIKIGFNFYLQNFFKTNGVPKYYHNKVYPIDIHCPGQLLVTLSILNEQGNHRELAEKVMHWTFTNMQDKRGFFYYQIKKTISSKISYMRWSNAFMFYSLSYYFLKNEND